MTLILKAVELDKCAAAFKKKYPTHASLQQAGWLLQPKYDGVFGMAIIRLERSECSLLTRTGEPIRSCDHILDQLHAQAGEEAVYLGELWHPIIPFSTISGLVRRFAPSPELGFVINDKLPVGLTTARPYSWRYNEVVAAFPGPGAWSVLPGRLFAADIFHASTPADELAASLKAKGSFDGAILRDPCAGYHVGLVKQGEIVKVKPTLSLDLEVVGVQEKVGERTGRPVLVLDVIYNGVISSVGSGVPHGLGPEVFRGAIVEVEAMGVTPDGKLREPRFKGIRYDKEQAD